MQSISRNHRLSNSLPCLKTKRSIYVVSSRWRTPQYVVSCCYSQTDGIAVSSISTPTGTYRGIKVTKDVPEGHILVRVPAANLLKARPSDDADERLAKVLERGPPGDDGKCCWQISLALQVLYHRYNKTHLSAYTASLPGVSKESPTPPVGYCFTPGAIHALQYAPLQEDLTGFRWWVERFWTQVLGPIQGGPSDPFNGMAGHHDLDWAIAVSTSRAFKARGTGQRYMVPTVDMANHSLEANCQMVVAEADDAVGLVTAREVKADEEATLCYGPFSNEQLLTSFGFIIPNNPHDTFRFRFDAASLLALGRDVGLLPGDGPQPGVEEWQLRLLHQLGLSRGEGETEQEEPLQHMVEFCRGPQLVEGRLLAAARVLCCQDPASISCVEDLTHWETKCPSDEAALQLLVTLAAGCYKSFPTTLEEDMALLAELPEVQRSNTGSAVMSMRERADLGAADLVLAVQFRVELKRLLLEVLQGLVARC